MDRSKRKLSVVIVDDEKRALRYLQTVVSELFPELEIIGTASTVQGAIKTLEEKEPDLLLLDIELTDGKGFDILEAVPLKNTQVIMVTAYDEYALRAIKARVLDYIVKPLDPEELRESIDFLFNKSVGTESKNAKKITINQLGKDVILDVNELKYLHSEGSYTKLYLMDGTIVLASRNLLSFEEELPNSTFCRCHRSNIVNINAIQSYSKNKASVLLKGGTEIPVSRSRKLALQELLSR